MRDVTYPLELALIALLVLGHVNAGIDFLRPQAPMTCTMVADKNVVFNNQGSFVLTFQPVTTVSTNANAKLTIPLKWSTDSKRNVVNTGSTTTTCSIQLASGGSAAACTVTPILATCNLSPLTVGQSYTITCTNIMNPTSTAPTGVFALSSFQGTTTQDTCSNLQISNYIANSIDIASAAFTIQKNNQNVTPNTQGIGNILFTIASPFYSTDTILIQLASASGVTFTLNPSYTLLIGGQFQSVSKGVQTASSIQLTQNSGSDRSAGAVFQIIIDSLISGPSTAPAILQISTTRGGFVIDQLLNKLSFQPKPGSLTLQSTITPTYAVISKTTTYSFHLQLQNAIKSNGYLVLNLPSELDTVAPITCTMQVSTNPVVAGTCTADPLTGLVITAKNLFNANPDPASQLTLRISGITNAKDTDAQLIFSNVESYYGTDSDFLVDELQAAVVVSDIFQPGAISAASAKPDSQIVGERSNLELKFTIADALPANGYLVLTIPEEIQFANTVGQTCELGGGVPTQCTLTYPTAATVRIADFTTAELPAGSSQTLKINRFILNPRSTRPTQTFSLQSFKTNDAIINTISTFSGFSVTTATSFNLILLQKRDSPNNGAVTKYFFSVTLKTAAVNGANLVIDMPGYQLSTDISCTSETALLKSTLVCQRNSNTQVTVTLSLKDDSDWLPVSVPLSIVIDKIKNSRSFSPSKPITFNLYDDTYIISSYTKTDIVVTNTVAGSISNQVMTVVNGEYGELDTYIFSFSTQNSIDSNCVFTLQVPSQIQITTNVIDCSANFIGFTGAPTCTLLGRLITVKPNGAMNSATNFGFAITSVFQNPATLQTGSFTIQSYELVDGQQYLIDQYTGSSLAFAPKCTLPCKKCSSQNKAQCLSCYSNTQITTSIYYNQDTLTCLVSCGDTYYQDDKTRTCTQCSSNCLQCDAQLTCTACATNFLLSSGKCVSACLSNQFIQSGVCVNCDDSCLTCGTQANLCTDCLPSLILFGQQCIDKCADGLFLDKGTCVGCQSPCLKCENTPSECTTCASNSNTPLLQGKTCTATCQDGYWPNLQEGSCDLCVSPCALCKNASECLTCIQEDLKTYFQLGTQCLETCPDLYFPDGFTCTKCEDGCVKCTQSDCLECKSTFFKLGLKCLENCPEGYVNNQEKGLCDKAPEPSVESSAGSTTVSSKSTTQAVDTVKENLSSNRYVPVPFLILYFLVGLTVIVSKIHRQETFVPGAVLGLAGGLEWASWITLMYLYDGNQEFVAPVYLGVAIHYLINIVNAILIKIKILGDPEYEKWFANPYTHKVTAIIVYIFSLITTFKTSRLLYCKYFAFSFFKCKLTSVNQFQLFNILNGISILVTTLPISVGAAIIAYNEEEQNQLFISAIDCFIVTVLLAVFQIWETKKDENFFEEPSAQNYYSLTATKLEKGEDSGFFHNPFHKSINVNEHENGSDIHQNENKQEQSVRAAIEPLQEDKLQSDRQSQIKDGAFMNRFHEDPAIQASQNSQLKSNSKHTIYFGQNPPYKFSNVQPIDIKDDQTQQDSLRSDKDKSQSNRYKTRSPQLKSSQVNERIQEQAVELDPDEEPQQPQPKSLTIDSQTRNNKKDQDDQQQTLLNTISQPKVLALNATILSQKENLSQAANSIPVEQQRIQSYGEPNDADDSKLSIFENDESQMVVVNANDKQNKRKNSFDSVSKLPQSSQSSLAAKTLIHGAVASEAEPSLPIVTITDNQEENSRTPIISQQKGVRGETKQVEDLQVKVESMEQSALLTKNNGMKSDKDNSRSNITSNGRSQAGGKPVNNKQVNTSKTQDGKSTASNPQRQPRQNPNPNPVSGRSKKGNVISPNAHEEIPKHSVKTNPRSPPLSQRSPPQKSPKQDQGDDRMKQIFDSNESIHTLSDANWGENQISPSDFNVLNQRYDDDQPKVAQAKSQNHQRQTIGSVRGADSQPNGATRTKSLQKKTTLQQSPPEFSGDEYRIAVPPGPYRTSSPPRALERGNVNPLDEATLRQLEQGRLKDIEKIYLQRIENTGGKQSNKKKTDHRTRQKDISDALFIDDNFDENDIIF